MNLDVLSAWYILISQYLVPWPVNSYHPSDLISDATASGKPSLISSSKSSYFWVFTRCSRHCDKCFTCIVSCRPFTIFWCWLLLSFYLWENWGTVILIISTRSDSDKWCNQDSDSSSLVQILCFSPPCYITTHETWAHLGYSLWFYLLINCIEIDFIYVYNIPLDSTLLESKDHFFYCIMPRILA